MLHTVSRRKAQGKWMDNSTAGPILVLGVGVFIFLIFFISIQLRRMKYRKIAEELGAEYQSQGLLRGGTIAGSSDGRQYSIRTRDTGRGRGSSNWTAISMRCTNQGIPLLMESGFFKSFPNWKYAFSVGDRTQKVLGAAITLQNAPVRLEEKYQSQVESLFHEVVLLHSDLLKKGYLRIQQDQITFNLHGVLRNAEVARQSVALLADLAHRIESNPVA
jgi:hypothetical protein